MGDRPLTEKLRLLKLTLRRWNKEKFGNIEKKISELEEEQDRTMRRLEASEEVESNETILKAISSQLKKWYERQESYWRQVSRERHVKLGDRNTKDFHALAVGRRRKAQIEKLLVGQRRISNQNRIRKEIVWFYRQLYHQPRLPSIHMAMNLLPRISNSQAVSLERQPSKEETRSAAFLCDPSKASGYDGFNLNFVKKMWGTLEPDINKVVWDFFLNGEFPAEINTT